MTDRLLPPDHNDEAILGNKLGAVKNKINPGEIYHHYKDSSKLYKVVAISLLEATEEVAIVYQALYGRELIWVRPWKNWSESVEYNGQLYQRFNRVST